ncbi:hypothetical protein [Lentiprolixibacter aurantiacus]|uniref:Bulb-type lectin domain-containing protein n=1 Tax=Lentiprolixibacter aurantiacus TaxID=2993939 RepID=A0AAE3MK62_9FLAO|nr:hypothetical protein [Lentiprolixibacter aurantiacus]MCX2718627.1 hypothetical protein [Lentiprolixibacter aurantiacus]
MSKILSVLLLLAFSIFISCSVDSSGYFEIYNYDVFQGELVWIKNFGGSGDDTAQSVIATIDGGYAVLGYTNSIDGDLQGKALNVNDYWLLKLDVDGNMEWSRTYGGSKDDRGQSIIQTQDGGYAITGYAMSNDGDGTSNNGFHDNWILKLDAQGNLEWEKSFGFSGHDHSYDLVQTADGGFFFVGFLDITSALADGTYFKGNSLTRHGVGEFWGTKIDASGNLEWRSYYGGTNNDRAHAVVQADDGGFVMAGFSESDDFDITSSRGSYDFWVVKISSTGELVWERSFGGSGIEIAYDIAKTKTNSYLITGHTFSTDQDVASNNGEADSWLIHLSDEGNLIWEQTYGGSSFDAAHSVKVISENQILIAGNAKSNGLGQIPNAGENDMWLAKTDLQGQLIWQMTFGGSALDLAFDAVEDREQSLILVGSSDSSDFQELENKGGTDLIVLKLQ